MKNNKNLSAAKNNKYDEFYTKYDTVKNEVSLYKDVFRGKIVYLNCDSVDSNFWKFFKDSFADYGIAKLIATHYSLDGKGIMSVTDDGISAIETELEGNGDCFSEECLSILDGSDIVVTNPPYSRFDEYAKMLVDRGKTFLIIGPLNAITYKSCFKNIYDKKMWLGQSLKGTKCHFIVNDDYNGNFTYNANGVKYAEVNNSVWFTNIDYEKRHTEYKLTEEYSAEKYPKYDNYDGVEVPRAKKIPKDFYGVMGVPISFMLKLSPEQFELIGKMSTRRTDSYEKGYPMVGGKKKFARILIKRKIT